MLMPQNADRSVRTVLCPAAPLQTGISAAGSNEVCSCLQGCDALCYLSSGKRFRCAEPTPHPSGCPASGTAGHLTLEESLINSAAHLRRIFSRLLPVEKPAVRQVLPGFFAVAYEKICTGSAPPHLIIASLGGRLKLTPDYYNADTPTGSGRRTRPPVQPISRRLLLFF